MIFHLCHLGRFIRPEILNKFDPEVLVYPRLVESDYLNMIKMAESHLPREFLLGGFRAVAERAIPQAVRDQTGARFLEIVLGRFFAEAAEGLFVDEIPS